MLALVIPMLNEAEALPGFWRRLLRVLKALEQPIHIIAVDDGSTDKTLSVLRKVVAQQETPHHVVNVTALRLSRNFGHQQAITAGLFWASQQAFITAAVVMDADGQDPPELLPEMIRRWEQGDVDVVSAQRCDRSQDHWLKRVSASGFYWLINMLRDQNSPPMTPNVGDYRLLGRCVLEALANMPERNRYVRGLIEWLGFEQAVVTYQRPAREAGVTKYTLRRMLRFASDGVIGFSKLPLRLISLIGLGLGCVSFLGFGVVLFEKLLLGWTLPGWASLMSGVLLLGSMQLMALGVLGEYLGRVLDEVRQRPNYIVASVQTLNRQQEVLQNV